jgi:hypothetical protein
MSLHSSTTTTTTTTTTTDRCYLFRFPREPREPDAFFPSDQTISLAKRVGARIHIYSAKATLLVVEPGSGGL